MATMQEAFVNGLSALYQTEQLFLQGAPQVIQGVQSEEVKQLFQQHEQETRQQVQRLEQIFESLGQKPGDVKPKGIEGILAENQEIQSKGYDPATQDAELIAAAQRIEHYEIAGYGTQVTLAQQLGHTQAADLLSQTLQEEKSADQKLTQVAESQINPKAAQAA